MREIIAVMKKDFKESILLNPTQIIVVFAIMLFLFYMMMDLKQLASFPGIRKLLITFETIPLIILMSLNILMEMFYKERIRRGFEAIMATGTSLEKIWIGKTMAVVLPIYAIYLLSLLIVLAIKSSWGILKEPGLAIEVLITAPLVAIALIFLIGIAFMISEKGRAVITGLFYTFFTILFFSNFFMKKLIILMKITIAWYNLALFFLAVVLLALALVWIKNLDREKIILI